MIYILKSSVFGVFKLHLAHIFYITIDWHMQNLIVVALTFYVARILQDSFPAIFALRMALTLSNYLSSFNSKDKVEKSDLSMHAKKCNRK